MDKLLFVVVLTILLISLLSFHAIGNMLFKLLDGITIAMSATVAVIAISDSLEQHYINGGS